MRMGRPLRIEYPGAVYMVSAFSGSRPLFVDQQDFSQFLDIVEKTAKRYDWKCYSYCLLPDQFHLLLEIQRPNLSLGMRQVNGIYTQYYHRTYRSRGSLLKDRFKSLLVEKETYMLPLARYMARLPVERGLVKGPAKWPWSAHSRLMRDPRPNKVFLDITAVIAAFEDNSQVAQKAYKQFIKEGKNALSPLLYRRRNCLGSDTFCSEILRRTETPKKRVSGSKAHIKSRKRPSLNALFSRQNTQDKKKRNIKILAAHVQHGYLIKEIAEHLDIHYTTVSKVINKS
jgi:putative transposase